MPTVFISYSTSDKNTAIKLTKDLKKSGINIWIDQEKILVGDSIIDKINQALLSSDFLIILISKAAINSSWVREELSAAKTKEIESKGVFILPVLLETCDIPPLISSKRYADFRESYQHGLSELLSVFGRTFARTSDSSRYKKLENDWNDRVTIIDQKLIQLLKEIDSKKSKVHNMHAINALRNDMKDALDIYRALRPLEKARHLAVQLDSSAYLLAILSKSYDTELNSYKNRYSSEGSIGLNIFLNLGILQANCSMDDESIWNFRKALRLAIAIKEDINDAALLITYNLTRVLSHFNSSEDMDQIFGLFVFDDKNYLKKRCENALECYRIAIQRELLWDLEKDPVSIASYGLLMEYVGLWKEALPYLEKAQIYFPKDSQFNECIQRINTPINNMEEKGNFKMSGIQVWQIAPFNCQFGNRQRFDDLIQKYAPEFWNDIVLGINSKISSELENKLFPSEEV